jgi:molecular chaperone DnaJ
LRGSGRGDQHVVVNMEVPSKLTAEQRELFEKLAQTMGSEIHPQERGFFDILKEVLGG